MTHARIWVRNLDVTPDTFGELEISGGRGDWLDDPEPVSVSVSMEWPGWAASPVVGDPVQVAGWLPHSGTPEQSMAALFAGQVTDVSVEDGIVSIVAVDPLRRLDGLKIGDVPWPAESWTDRLDRVRAAVSAALPSEDRDWFDRWDWPAGTPGNVARAAVAWRDVDAQDALQLLRDHLRVAGQAVWFRPHEGSRVEAPADPAVWRPKTGRVSAFADSLWAKQPVPVVPAGWIVDDPGPRLYQNMGVVVNLLELMGPRVDAAGRPVEGGEDQASEWAYGAGVPLVDRSRYGLRSGRQETRFGVPVPGGSMPGEQIDLGSVARAWLGRMGYPWWGCDGVTVDVSLPDPDVLDADARRIWLWLARAAEVGQPVDLESVFGASERRGSEDTYRWVIEQRTIRWTEEGWEIDLETLSDRAVYLGSVTHPIDPRNQISLQGLPAQPWPSGGVLLVARLLADGVQGAAGGWWRVLLPDAGIDGQIVENRGGGTLLPTPGGVPAGRHRVVVQWLEQPDATVPRHRLELWVDVAVCVTWAELPTDPDLEWRWVPPATTWAEACSLDALTGGGGN